jgi:membrane associated rhomboid family serine protease
MIPLRDLNRIRRFPAITILLIAVNIAVFLYQTTLDRQDYLSLVRSAGLIPFQATHHPDVGVARDLLTSMFLHGSWLHLLTNMLYLWIFGANVEDTLGSIPFIVFYLVCGTIASLALVITQPETSVPTLGASGAIAGVLGAYLILFPGARVQTLVFFVYFIRIIEVRAVVVLGIWILLQILYGLSAARLPGGGGIAYAAHVGGFVVGAIVATFIRVSQRKSVTKRNTIADDKSASQWE